MAHISPLRLWVYLLMAGAVSIVLGSNWLDPNWRIELSNQVIGWLVIAFLSGMAALAYWGMKQLPRLSLLITIAIFALVGASVGAVAWLIAHRTVTGEAATTVQPPSLVAPSAREPAAEAPKATPQPQLSVYLSCIVKAMPKLVHPDSDGVWVSRIHPGAVKAGPGRLYAPTDRETSLVRSWPDSTVSYRCEVRNYSDQPISSITMVLPTKFYDTRERDSNGSVVRRLHAHQNTTLAIHEALDARTGRFEFYLWTGAMFVAELVIPSHVTVTVLGSSEAHRVPLAASPKPGSILRVYEATSGGQ